MLALSDADAPDRVLAVLSALRAEHGEKLEQFPDLACAMCVVWDTPRNFDADNPRADTERPVWLFKYLVMAQNRLRFDPQEVPWELAIYIADIQVSQDEMAWAVKRYAQRGAIGGTYFDVPYDLSAFYGTAEKAIGAHDYTLPNLARFGGVCVDQAYFASNVARSVGVPACVCVGMGGASEVGHAWVGYLELRGRAPAWNFSEGRYPELQFWKGTIQDPQTRQNITDSDVGMLAELARTSPRDRLASRAMCRAADLAGPKRMEVYTKAIDLSPGNRDAWLALAQLGADLKLTDAQYAQVMQVVSKFAAKNYPDFALAMIQKLNSGRGTDQQTRALRQAKQLFTRPDLLAALRLAEADLLRAAREPAGAMAAYGEVLRQYHNAGPIVLDALERVEQLCRDSNDLPRLAAIYSQAWQRMQHPRPTAYVQTTPYFFVGRKYQYLLEEIGQSAEAQRVRARLNSLAGQRASP
jgi:hypothetical protein